ncbi:CRISPR-associated endonuclease Cas2 [Roseibacillus persicicus]|uniref:CRISPR-associated endonuclease Cas2 n=1 Tax=Roseibacillus persicicus TaxID=454148 RepID=UPI00398AD542
MASRSLSNNRHVYLCTYDVAGDKAGDKRRNRIFELLRDHGEHVQYSVFLCTLTRTEVANLGHQARDILNEKEDQLLVINVGPEVADWQNSLTCHGKTWSPQIRARIV